MSIMKTTFYSEKYKNRPGIMFPQKEIQIPTLHKCTLINVRSLEIVILINTWVVLHFPGQNIEKWKNAGVIFSRNNYIEAIIFWASTLFDIRSYFVQKFWRKLHFYFFRTLSASDFTPNFFHHKFRLLTIFLRLLNSVYVPKMKGIYWKPRGVEQNI